MKKILFAILGTVFLFSACTKNEIPKIEQNPYRLIIPYTPGTVEMTVPGTLTAVGDYSSWMTMTQSGNTASFTVRRNTTGLIRRAEFTIAGESFIAAVNQEAHSLDAKLSLALAGQSLGAATVQMTLATSFGEDYATWGVIYGKESDMSKGKDVPQSKVSVGKNTATITGLEDGVDYYFWAYVVSTEGDKVYSNMMAVIPPVYVKAGDDLQAALEGAKEYADIRVQGGVVFTKTIKFSNSCKNKSISGGWDATFSTQSMDNLTVLDLAGTGFGVWCAGDDSFGPLDGSAEISYFEIKNTKGDHGSAIHACGGPVTVHHCYIHDNECEKGAIGTREEDYSTTLTVYNCVVSDNRANAHGAAFGFGDGANYDDQVMATLVNNLIINNTSYKYDGYCAVYICYNNTDLVFVNNTVVGNFNYKEYGGEYPGMNHRGNVRSLFANNIIVGNRTSDNVTPPVKEPFQYFFSFDNGAGTFAFNVYEGQLKSPGNATVSDNYMFDAGFDITSVVANPDALDYSPRGVAVNGGTLKTLEYKENRDSAKKSVDIAALLDKYNTDLSGDPRVVDGKVSCGCFQK